nr:putative ribonuclease H-like domain-containing protein [Tanacetum cinerariifolium]
MDVKSAFLYDIIEEEVYVCQPPGFKDPYFPDKVYKLEKALYGLHQALRAYDAHEIPNEFYGGTQFLLRVTDQGRINDEDLFGVNDLDGDEVIVDVTAIENVEQDATVAKKEVSAAAYEVVTTAESVEEPEKLLKKKDQIAFNEEVARKLDAQMKAKIEEEERIVREKDKADDCRCHCAIEFIPGSRFSTKALQNGMDCA